MTMTATAPVTAAGTEVILSIQNVESYYGPIMAIRGVSLEVREGQIVTVLGANGAGKTTLMKTISGVMDPEKGKIVYQGRNIAGANPDKVVRAGIVHVPEGREVFPLLTVEENLRMGAFTRSDTDGIRRDEEMVFSYFPILAERRAQAAGTLSAGSSRCWPSGAG
jgi:branched-chain amino acid transport system ATP-binding protein